MGSFDVLINAGAAAESFAALVGSGGASAQAPIAASDELAASAFGTTIVSGADSFPAIVEMPSIKEIAWLAEGAGIDAANHDIRWIVASCRAFTAESYPVEGARIAVIEAGLPVSFTVLSRSTKQVAGIDTQLRLLVYRTPQPDSATVAPAGEAGAGAPKQYAPSPNPY